MLTEFCLRNGNSRSRSARSIAIAGSGRAQQKNFSRRCRSTVSALLHFSLNSTCRSNTLNSMTFPFDILILLLAMPQQLDLRAIEVSPWATTATVGAGLRQLKPDGQAASSGHEAETAARTLDRARILVNEVISASYPELKGTEIQIKLFDSKSDYFKARFGIPQFFFGRMQYLVFVNPRVFDRGAPDAGVRAILAHELGHVLYFKTRNRLKLLGLVRLASKASTQRFERWADLQAISRGYGEGLKEYRQW